MMQLDYLIAGWGIPLVAIAIYAVALIRRGNALSARVPVERRRWISTDD